MLLQNLFRASTRSLSRRSHPQPARTAQLRLEGLEDRTAPAILFGDNPNLTVSDNNGPVLANAQVRLIFWGTGWDSGVGPALRNQVQNAIDTLNASTYFYSPLPGADLSQYRPGAQSRPVRVASLSTTYLTPGSTFDNNRVFQMLQHEYGMTPNFYYYVIPDPNSAIAGGGTLAEHTYWFQGSSREYYGFTRNLPTPSLDDLTALYSHEMAESITDPDGTALQVNPRGGSGWNEICDGEAQNYYYRVNGVLAQAYWSRANGKFTVPTGQSQNFFVSSGRVLTVNGDQLANHDDAITLDVSGGGVRVSLNGEVAQFDPGRISSIVVNAGAGHDTVTVANTISGVPVTINTGNGGSTVNVLRDTSPVTIHGGGGLDNVNIGNAGSLANIFAPIDVSNPPSGGYTALTVDTSGFTGTYTATLSDTSLSFGGVPITYRPGDLRSLTLRGGNGNNTYNILNTPSSGYSGGMTTTVLGGTAVDTMNVLRTSGPLFINGGGGLDNVNIGNAGSVAGILAPIDVSNPPSGGYTALTVDTSAYTGTYTATLSGTSLSFGGPAITYRPGDLRSLTVRGGSGDDIWIVNSTPSSGLYTSTTITTGGGTNAVNVRANSSPVVVNAGNATTVTVGNAGRLTAIGADVVVTNASGFGTLVLDDSADPSSTSPVVTAGTVSYGNPNAVARYSGLAGLTVLGGSGGNTFSVLGSSAAITLDGGTGTNTLVGSNSGNVWTLTGTDAGVLAGPAYGTDVSFGRIQNLRAGIGSDYFVFADGASITGNLTGNGADTLNYSLYSTSVIVDLQTGSATGVGGTVSGIGTVDGGSVAPANSSVYNLLIGNGGNTLQGGAGRRNILVAGGAASILVGGDGEDLIIAGSTTYDTEAGLASWQAIAAYWTGADDYATRVGNLTSGAGVPLLDATTVTGNGGGNTLTGNGALALLYTDGLDNITGFDPSSQQVAITP